MTIQVTPAELAGVAGQLRALARSVAASLGGLRSAAAAVEPADSRASPILLAAAHQMWATASDLVADIDRLVSGLSVAVHRQASGLEGAARGYAQVEGQVAAAALAAGGRRPP